MPLGPRETARSGDPLALRLAFAGALAALALLVALPLAGTHSGAGFHGTLTLRFGDDPEDICDRIFVEARDLDFPEGRLLFSVSRGGDPDTTLLEQDVVAEPDGAGGFAAAWGPFTRTDLGGVTTALHATLIQEGPEGEFHAVDTATFAIPCLPCPPVVAEALGSGAIRLDWPAVDGADFYSVARFHAGQTETFLVATEETHFLDEATETGETYAYGVTPRVDVDDPGTDCPHVTVTAIPVFPSPVGAALALVAGMGGYAMLRRRP